MKLIQAQKLKISLKNKIIIAVTFSAVFITGATGIFIYFNSISGKSRASTLPTTITLFTANLNTASTQVLIYWVTEAELNCDYFTIQRSADGGNYIQLTEIAAAGTSTVQMTYNYTDPNPLAGVSYYRLRYTDLSGEYHYGAIQSVNNEFVQPENTINLYPIPALNYVYVSLNISSASTSHLKVIDITGKIVGSLTPELTEGKNKIKLDIHDLPNGIYFVNLEDQSGNMISQKMIKTE